MNRRTFGKSISVLMGAAVRPNGLLGAFAAEDASGTQPANTDDGLVINEGFEGAIPDLHTHQAEYFADDTMAHGGRRSLRVVPTEKSGGAYFRLDGLVDLKSDYEFSAWARAGEDGSARLYISASDGKQRHTKAHAAPHNFDAKPGDWVHLVGTLRGEEWNATDRDVMMALFTTGECRFDDVVLRKTHIPPPPIATYPVISRNLRAKADRLAVTLSPGAEVVLKADRGVLAAGFAAAEVRQVAGTSVELPPDGMLVFAVDAPRAVRVSGIMHLEPGADLRPGLRACVMCDSTVLATPMVQADAWVGVGPRTLTGAMPDVTGTRPAEQVELTSWFLPAGRHYLMVAAPHFRGGGTFRGLQLRVSGQPAPEPLYQFALLSDTHLGSGRSLWMNYKMNEPAREELAATLASLKAEQVRFALIAGDMTDLARREQFDALGRICRNSGLPVYGCIGNHDSYLATSRPDALELCPELFPGGTTDYVLDQSPLRFIVLDASYWKDRNGVFMDHYDPNNGMGIGIKPEQVDWLRETLAADTKTPTLAAWHYPFLTRGGLSTCGYQLPAERVNQEVLDVLEAAPNVVGTLAGHTHWNHFHVHNRLHHVTNPAFCEWPNAYRVFRVYADHIEWELRQVGNRGFVRESFAVPKALSWQRSTVDDDLRGTTAL